jgi:DNA-binding NtrC family response regulator
LRQRKEDIGILVNHFLGGQGFSPSTEILDVFSSYDWPGNVRELKHCVDRMAAMQSEGALQMQDLPSALQYHHAGKGLDNLSDAIDWGSDLQEESLSPRSPVISLPASEKQTITKALAATHGERAKAARLLGIGRTTLYRKLKEYGFESQ